MLCGLIGLVIGFPVAGGDGKGFMGRPIGSDLMNRGWIFQHYQ
jgi:hypothetical protein